MARSVGALNKSDGSSPADLGPVQDATLRDLRSLGAMASNDGNYAQDMGAIQTVFEAAPSTGKPVHAMYYAQMSNG